MRSVPSRILIVAVLRHFRFRQRPLRRACISHPIVRLPFAVARSSVPTPARATDRDLYLDADGMTWQRTVAVSSSDHEEKGRKGQSWHRAGGAEAWRLDVRRVGGWARWDTRALVSALGHVPFSDDDARALSPARFTSPSIGARSAVD
ncbi:hypothetical protein MVEN_02176000 [Mycena venus]|uniref:Uncharacterized protein n=1 Tax=Mycena venus TaxID=2733690 RepID=A0A8H6X8Y1_9AGAR|nr:hypothetical protein MVEN_02176000 [Mycena venus]